MWCSTNSFYKWLCVCVNPIYGWRVAWRKLLVKCVVTHAPALCGSSLIRCNTTAAPAPWLLIIIQNFSLQEQQERPLDSSNWIKPDEYASNVSQVNATEWGGLFVTLERASGFCICEWGCDHSMNTLLARLSVELKCQLSLHSTPHCSQPSLPKCKVLSYTTWERDRERDNTQFYT